MHYGHSSSESAEARGRSRGTRRPMIGRLLLALLLSPAVALAQSDSQPPGPRPPAELVVTAQYDSTLDSTAVEVELERGRYRMFSQRPRVVAALSYAGRTPSAWPDTVLVRFTTQAPQYIRSASMLLTTTDGHRVTALSRRSEVKKRAFTVDHTVTFAVPIEELRPLVESSEGLIEVGGIKVKLQRRHFEALGRLIGYQ